ncbi:unnamed protein product [Closterium sp. Naga37s-1]|nr:unnamed protein product [Closterium sp. Naga37s-1]
MCPRYKPSNVTPIPDGSDPSACPRSILGVYDDRDFGWCVAPSRPSPLTLLTHTPHLHSSLTLSHFPLAARAHGYKRLMHKDPLKTVFLDALGAPKEDPRRDRGDGIQAVVRGGAGRRRREAELPPERGAARSADRRVPIGREVLPGEPAMPRAPRFLLLRDGPWQATQLALVERGSG